jgi:DNA-binding ferritin-like protein
MPDEKPVAETLETIAEKLTSLGKSQDARFEAVDQRFEGVDKRFEAVDKRFETVDMRFDEVSEAFVEQRKYTEFAFDQLRAEMNGGFGRLDRKLDRVLETLTRNLSSRRRRRS